MALDNVTLNPQVVLWSLSLPDKSPALLHAVGTAMAGGIGDGGVHGNVTQPHTSHLSIVHSLDEHGLQALQYLHHLCPLYWPVGLMHPVLLGMGTGK